jgi:alanyl-tRNA synthetase|tara:strand:- start:3096 stop:5693 length:2598 start_codon:yes stop_codon:yes gene_type:complete
MEGSAQIRSAFLDYFQREGHTAVPTSSLVPAADATLLFTNAGMVQFKDVFLGNETLPYVRATSSQRCVRAGGKHNDLENVGYTARHHTFFEMLGNFSFGDYFKREAIHYAWDFLTKVAALPVDRLWVTVFEDDAEAAKIWLDDIGVNPERLRRIGAKDNFWSMGDTGPCGPCTEIFYDHGEHIAGGPPGSPDEDGDRYVEIWNLVFMQYERDSSGHLNPLSRPSVDTGMGLERLCAVLQGVNSNYDTDLFQGLIQQTAEMAKIKDLQNPSLKVIADHIRSCSFLIADGVMPSNEGRGYVLRRIIRRAARHGHRLGLQEPFFHTLVKPLIESLHGTFPELIAQADSVQRGLLNEEMRFAETLTQGMRILQDEFENLSGNTIAGETVFKLYDTFGFPVDLTADVAREKGLSLDLEGFQREMQQQRERAREASRFGEGYDVALDVKSSTIFTGYSLLEEQSEVSELFIENQAVERVTSDQEAIIFCKSTPFYAESGGQVGDQGLLLAEGVRFEVSDTQKRGNGFAHFGKLLTGEIKVGQMLTSQVDQSYRNKIVLNHSATHLMHAALREVLGPHVQQKGSLVNAERLRFDFSHDAAVTRDQIRKIEQLVNQQIRKNTATTAELMNKEEALAAGAMALFGEKYGDEVRVLSIGDFSTELCGGTHVERAGDIGSFIIVAESGTASGVRRIEALTGPEALRWLQDYRDDFERTAQTLNAPIADVVAKSSALVERNKELEKELSKIKAKVATQAGADIAGQAIEIEGCKVLAYELEGADSKALRETLDKLKDKLGSAAIVLASISNNKVSLVAGVTKDQTAKIKAGDLVNMVAQQVGGKGGGRPEMAQAGGDNPAALAEALKSVPIWIREQL